MKNVENVKNRNYSVKWPYLGQKHENWVKNMPNLCSLFVTKLTKFDKKSAKIVKKSKLLCNSGCYISVKITKIIKNLTKSWPKKYENREKRQTRP